MDIGLDERTKWCTYYLQKSIDEKNHPKIMATLLAYLYIFIYIYAENLNTNSIAGPIRGDYIILLYIHIRGISSHFCVPTTKSSNFSDTVSSVIV